MKYKNIFVTIRLDSIDKENTRVSYIILTDNGLAVVIFI